MATQREIQLVLKLVDQASKQLSSIQSQLGQLQKVQSNYQQAQQSAQKAFQVQAEAATKGRSSIKGLADTVTSLASSYFFVTNAVQSFAAASQQAYGLLIGSNEKLNAQLLSSAGTIAATSNVLQDGSVITDKTKAIQALLPSLRAATKELQKDTLELSNVEDAAIFQTFSTVLSQSGQFTNQLNSIDGSVQKYGNSIEAAKDLTKSLVASLGSLNVPLSGAVEEVRSLIQGTITSDSTIARSLGITNADIQKARATGSLIDFLNDKLQSFVASNRLASTSIESSFSNIKQVIGEVSRDIGEPLQQFIASKLQSVFESLNANKDAFKEFGQAAIDELIPLLESAQKLAATIGEDLAPLLEQLAPIAKSVTITLIDGFKLASQAISDSSDFIRQNAEKITSFLDNLAKNPILAPFIQQFKLLSDILGKNGGNVFQTAADGFGLITGSTERSTEAIETYGKQTDQALSLAQQSQQDLTKAQKEYNDAKASGRDLTKAEIEEIRSAVDVGKTRVQSLKDQKQALIDARAGITGEGNRAAIEAQIGSIDRQIDANQRLVGSLEEVAANVEIQAIPLKSLGSVFDDLARQADTLKNRLAGATNNEEASKAASDLVKLTQERLRLGAITQQQAVDELKAIANNSTLSADTRIAAEEAVQKVYTQTSKNRQASIDTELQQIENLADKGSITRIEAEKRVTQARKREIDVQIQDLQNQLKRLKDSGQSDGQEATEARQQIAKLNAEREQLTIESGQKLYQLQVEQFDKSQQRLLDRTKLAENDRLTALEQLRAKEPLLESQIQAERLQIQRESLQKELQSAQNRLAFLEELGKQRGDSERTRQEEILKQRLAIGDLTSQLASNEIAQQEAITKVIQERIAREKQAIENLAQQQQLANDARIRSIEQVAKAQELLTQATQNQLKLLESIKEQQQASADLEKTRFDVLIEGTKDERERSKLKEAQALSEYRAKVEQLRIEKETFQIQERQRLNAIEQQRIQAQINKLKAAASVTQADAEAAQARSDFAKVAADPNSTPEQITAAQLQIKASDQRRVAARAELELASAQEQLLGEQQRIEQQASRNNRRAFDRRQQNELLQADAALAGSIADPNRRQQAINQLAREQRSALGSENQRINFQSDRNRARNRVNQGFAGIDEAGDRVEGIVGDLESRIQSIRVRPADVAPQNFLRQKVQAIAPTLIPRTLPQAQGQAIVPGQGVQVGQSKEVNQNITVSATFANTFADRDEANLLDRIREGLGRDLSSVFGDAAKQLASSGVI